MKNWNIVLALIFILGIGFGTMPIRKQLAAATLQRNVLETQKKKISKEFKAIQKNVHESENSSAFNTIPVGYDQAAFLSDIEKILEKNQFEVKNFSFSLGSDSTVEAEQIQASFQIQGSRGDIYNFLKDVEENKNFMGVQSFSISGESRQTDITFNVSLYSFFQKK